MSTAESVKEQNRILVEKWIEAFNQQDIVGIVSLYAEGAELFDSGMKRARRGRGEIEQWFTRRFRGMPLLTYTPTAQLSGDGQVGVTWIVEGNGPRIVGQSWLTRRHFKVSGVSIFAIEDGKIQKQHGYYDHLSVAEQLVPFLKKLVPIRL